VIAVDTNILVYAHRKDASFHEPARAVLQGLAEGDRAWAIPWPCVHEFCAVVTNPRVWRVATPVHTALDQIEAWRASPKVSFLAEDDGFWQPFQELLRGSRVQGGKVHDARIAALAVYHRVDVLFTADRDFSRFPAVKTENPL
jgi:hypothetical protein